MNPRTRALLLGFGLLLVQSSVALGADNSVTPVDKPDTAKVGYLRPQKNPAGPKETEVGSARQEVSPLRVSIALALLGGLAATALWLKKRQRIEIKAADGLALRAVSSIMLPGKSHVTLVSVGGEAMLLGISEAGMTLLRTYSKSELSDMSPSEAPAEPAVATTVAAKSTQAKASGARLAFREILENAAQSEAKSRAENARRYAESLHQSTNDDEEAPDSGPRYRDEDEDDMPPHLALALAETKGRDGFGEPEGQAAELMRRFRERKQ